ncbi:MAG: glycerol-3-phosphate 1-O-acyltransferase PlsY [Clostridia bacterium]|nr:glycerol-3-phosphate 1-O-acyltransferase PlsY [Clostridia bacterium]
MENFFTWINNGVIPMLFDNQLNGFMLVLCVLLSIVPAYFLGSLNFAVIFSRRMFDEDVRTKGSGNAGTTNMLRNYGKKAAVLTLGGDLLKAVVACAIGYVMLGVDGAYLAGMFCVLGHMFPIYYRFKGSKGVATTAAVVLMTNPLIFVIAITLFVIIVVGTKYVSLGSVMCAMLWPILLHRIEGPCIGVLVAFFIAAMIVFMHRANIKRLLEGKESKISLRSKKKEVPAEEDDPNA